MKAQLCYYFRAAYPCISINTFDERRVIGDVIAAAKDAKRKVVTWSATEGLVSISDGNRTVEGDTLDLEAACKTAAKFDGAVVIFRDPHTWPFDRFPTLLRALRDLIAESPGRGSTVVILAHEYKPHPTLEKLVTVLDYAMPTEADFMKIGADVAVGNVIHGKGVIDKDNPGDFPQGTDVVYKDEFIRSVDKDVFRACGGLTASEAENAMSLSVIETGGFDAQIIYREKILAVRRSGLLEIVDPDPRGLDAIGGMENLKEWLGDRNDNWSEDAIDYGLSSPKGMLAVGIPGCGKSLTGKCVGTAFGVPTLKLDVGALFNSLVGESEARTRAALKLAEAMAPCVLWLDEIEKGMAGMSGSGSGDSGVSKRVFGTVVTWMQERKRPVFLFATGNDVSSLPPELLRKGRLDEIFWVDLPTPEERATIFGIHLSKRKRTVSDFDLPALAEATPEFTGSEIEAVVEAALLISWKDGRRKLATADLIKSAKATTPLATTAKEKISALREWAVKTRARPAARPAPTKALSRKLG